LAEKPEIIAVTKVDAIDAETAEIVAGLLIEEAECPVHLISAVAHQGLEPVLSVVLDHVHAARSARALAEAGGFGEAAGWSPR
jgi:GTP-binding protein